MIKELKNELIERLHIDEKTIHVMSMQYPVRNITIKEFFEILESSINKINKDKGSSYKQ